MSFLTDLFEGKTSNLGHDLNPANITSDLGADTTKALKNPIVDVGLGLGGIALAPELLGALGVGAGSWGSLLGGAGGGLSSLFGGGAAADAGGDALALAAPDASLATDPAMAGINSALSAGGGIAGQTVGSTELLPAVAQDAASAAGGDGGGILDWMGNNKGLLTLLGAGIGGQVLSPAISQALGLNKVPGSQNLTNLANQEAGVAAQQQGQGQNLESYLTSGGLPAGQQQQVTNATNDAINTIKSRYAALGLSGSTAEADAISYAQNNAGAIAGQLQAQDYQLGQQAVSQAVTAMGLQEGIYSELLNATIAQDQQLGNAIGNFTKAIGTGVGQQAGKQLLAA